MTYQDILVHVPPIGCDEQIEAGISLAKAFGAHVTGICSLPEAALLKDALKNPFLRLSKEAVEGRVALEYERAAAAEQQFAAAAQRAGLSYSWLLGEGDAADLIVHACRLHDLAVVEQCGVVSELLWGPAVQLALSGHPAFIVPSAWQGAVVAPRALVAWNGSTQAASAVRNALPLLKRAEQVTLVQGRSRETFPATMRVPENDVLDYLRRHGVKVTEGASDVPDAEAGPAILMAAEEVGAQLIVMGAFGRSRFSEWILGGATRHVLEHMKIPVFMAH